MTTNLTKLIESGRVVIASRDAAWDVFNVGNVDDPLLEIQRVDDAPESIMFASDLEAIGYVLERAACGDEEARHALFNVYGLTFSGEPV